VYWSNEVTFKVGEDIRGFFITRGARRDKEYVKKNLRPMFKSRRTSVGI
jgi:hypothetical protein